MRIVYTNLKERDAGVTKSVRQLRVEFGGSGDVPAASRPVAGTGRIAAGEGPHDAKRAAGRADRPESEPVVEGASALRSMFIRKFSETRMMPCSGTGEGFSVVV
jgi:hypothetical protein